MAKDQDSMRIALGFSQMASDAFGKVSEHITQPDGSAVVNTDLAMQIAIFAKLNEIAIYLRPEKPEIDVRPVDVSPEGFAAAVKKAMDA